MERNLIKIAFLCGLCVFAVDPGFAQTRVLDLSKAANMGPSESFDGDTSAVPDADKKDGFSVFPTGSKTLRGIPFQLLDPSRNQGRSFVVLKGSRKPGFPEAVSIPAGYTKASHLYFLHTCRWGGTGPDVTVAEYNVIYGDGKVEVIPLRVGVEFANFFGADDTSASFLAWWHKYKKIEMGVSLFPWKNPRPEEPIQSILFKSRGRMPVPILFAITASERELAVAETSPKPETGFRTDTTGWLPFQPSDASPKGTAIDMSFLLDAPAGKHGKAKAEGDKLVFADGTPARFWGMALAKDWPGWEAERTEAFFERAAQAGCNLLLMDLSNVASNDRRWIEAFEKLMTRATEKGIYLAPHMNLNFIEPQLEKVLGKVADPSLSGTLPIFGEAVPGAVSLNILNKPKKKVSPQVLYPGKGMLASFLQMRVGGKAVAMDWSGSWEGMYGAEASLLVSSISTFQGLPLMIGGVLGEPGWGKALSAGEELRNEPLVFGQWPIAALAYLRGDLKEGSSRYFFVSTETPPAMESEGEDQLTILAHRSGMAFYGGGAKTNSNASSKAKIDVKNRTFTTNTGQITWQGNVGVVKVEAPRFQAVIGFLANRKFNNPYWSVETPNHFASISAISLTKSNLSLSDRILLTGVTRMENTGQVFNSKKTKLLDPGKAPILYEPLKAQFVLYRHKADPKLKVRALDANGHPLSVKVPTKWNGKNLVFSWVPSAFYFEVYKDLK